MSYPFARIPIPVRRLRDAHIRDRTIGWHAVNEANENVKWRPGFLRQLSIADLEDGRWPEDINCVVNVAMDSHPGRQRNETNTVQGAHVIPHSEDPVVCGGVWLRATGILSNDFLEAEAYKLSLRNMIYIQAILGNLMEFAYGGLIFLPTFDEALELIKLGEEVMYDYAIKKPNDTDFEIFESKDLAAKWAKNVKPGAKNVPIVSKVELVSTV